VLDGELLVEQPAANRLTRHPRALFRIREPDGGAGGQLGGGDADDLEHGSHLSPAAACCPHRHRSRAETA
jgi:hypothetical protein